MKNFKLVPFDSAPPPLCPAWPSSVKGPSLFRPTFPSQVQQEATHTIYNVLREPIHNGFIESNAFATIIIYKQTCTLHSRGELLLKRSACVPCAKETQTTCKILPMKWKLPARKKNISLHWRCRTAFCFASSDCEWKWQARLSVLVMWGGKSEAINAN